MYQFIEALLTWVVVPLWLTGAIADWWCHRQVHLETTSGPPETLLHLLLMVEGGAIAALWMVADVTGLVLIIMLVGFIAHEITVYVDVRYAAARRVITPVEQRVHDYLTAMPLVALFLIMAQNWEQALAIFGLGPEPFDGGLRFRPDPLPPLELALRLGAMTAIGVVPFAEELWRGLRDAPKKAR